MLQGFSPEPFLYRGECWLGVQDEDAQFARAHLIHVPRL
jgi:hypothetical protein